MSFILSNYDHYWKQTSLDSEKNSIFWTDEKNFTTWRQLQALGKKKNKEKKRKTVCVSVCIFQYQGKSIFNWPALRQTPNCRRNIFSINWPRTWKNWRMLLIILLFLRTQMLKKTHFKTIRKGENCLQKKLGSFSMSSKIYLCR